MRELPLQRSGFCARAARYSAWRSDIVANKITTGQEQTEQKDIHILGGETASFSYDANGNALTGNTSNSYNLADQLVKAVKGSAIVEFAYAPDGDRYVRVDRVDGANTYTLSLGGYERVDGDKQRIHKYSVSGIALVTEKERISDLSFMSRSVSYLVKDYLGSVRLELDANRQEESRLRYSPFGEQFNDSLNSLISVSNPITANRVQNRGYTGHEQLAAVGLIHMNGRVYDAKLGRFLQADPYIDDSDNLQALNRYSYVENNPFAATDPSGFFLKRLWKEIRPYIGAIVAVVLSIYAPAQAGLWYNMFVGAASGAAGAAANGGNVFRAAVLGAITGAISYGVAEGMQSLSGAANFQAATSGWKAVWVAASGASGGISARLAGGSFREGFMSAGLTQALSGYTRTQTSLGTIATNAIVGGSISELTGGKFANGAITASMQSIATELHDGWREDWVATMEVDGGFRLPNKADTRFDASTAWAGLDSYGRARLMNLGGLRQFERATLEQSVRKNPQNYGKAGQDFLRKIDEAKGSNLPTTRAGIDADLKSKGFDFKGISAGNGYATYKGPDGKTVTIKPTGEVIPIQKVWKSDGSGKFPQRQDYNGIPLLDQSHSTGHFVEPLFGPFRGSD